LLVIINGEERNIEDDLKVSDLVPLLELKAERLAIEVNRKIIRRVAWQLTPLAEGDKIEIVQFVGGGSVVGNSALLD
jgi:thiamine biosynthesis protein ThiS